MMLRRQEQMHSLARRLIISAASGWRPRGPLLPETVGARVSYSM